MTDDRNGTMLLYAAVAPQGHEAIVCLQQFDARDAFRRTQTATLRSVPAARVRRQAAAAAKLSQLHVLQQLLSLREPQHRRQHNSGNASAVRGYLMALVRERVQAPLPTRLLTGAGSGACAGADACFACAGEESKRRC